MQYMLLIVNDPKSPPPPASEMSKIVGDHMKFSAELTEKKKLVHASRLRPASDAKTVRYVGGKKVVVDGPFSETKESVGGYYVIECDSQAEAIEWAKKLPAACVEVNALWPVNP